MHEAIIEKLYNEYNANGFISEDNVFDTLKKEGVSLVDVEYICDQLLARGVIIIEGKAEVDDDSEEESADLTRTDYKAVFSEIIRIDEGLCDIVNFMKNVHPPQRREWQTLLPQAQNGNLYARNRVFEMYMRVAAKIALHYAKRYSLPLADTMQDAFCGLFVAIDKFEYGRQDHFSTYFPFWVRQNIMREARIKDAPFYIPVHVKDQLFVIRDLEYLHHCPNGATGRLWSELIADISLVLECDNKEAEYLYSLLRPIISFESIIEKELSENSEDSFSDFSNVTPCNEDDSIVNNVDSAELNRILNDCLKALTAKEEKVLRLRYGLDDGKERTLEEVGNILSVTRERIRQIEAKAFRKLRHPSTSKKLKCYVESAITIDSDV